MSIKGLFEKWNLSEIKLNLKFVEAKFNPGDKDKDAAWCLYIELLTRITTQPLSDDVGVEKTALESVYNIFPLTRDILKQYGRECIGFSKIAIPVLNQIIRPFTARWHKIAEENGFDIEGNRLLFRNELKELQRKLICYTSLLSDVAGVEDLTGLEDSGL